MPYLSVQPHRICPQAVDVISTVKRASEQSFSGENISGLHQLPASKVDKDEMVEVSTGYIQQNDSLRLPVRPNLLF